MREDEEKKEGKVGEGKRGQLKKAMWRRSRAVTALAARLPSPPEARLGAEPAGGAAAAASTSCRLLSLRVAPFLIPHDLIPSLSTFHPSLLHIFIPSRACNCGETHSWLIATPFL